MNIQVPCGYSGMVCREPAVYALFVPGQQAMLSATCPYPLHLSAMIDQYLGEPQGRKNVLLLVNLTRVHMVASSPPATSTLDGFQALFRYYLDQ